MGDSENSNLSSETPAKRQKLGEDTTENNSFEHSKFVRYYKAETSGNSTSYSQQAAASVAATSNAASFIAPSQQYGYGYPYSTGFSASYPNYSSTYTSAGYSYPYTQNQTAMAAYNIPNAQSNVTNQLQNQYSGEFAAYNYNTDQSNTSAYASYGYNPAVASTGTYGYNAAQNTITQSANPMTQGYTADDAYSTAPSRVIHCRGVADGCKESDLITVLQNFGNITYITLLPKIKQALVEFENIESAVSLHTYAQTQPLMVLNKQMYVNYSKSQEIKREKLHGTSEEAPSNVLLLTIKNPLHPITVKVLYAICNPYGSVQRIVIFHKNGLQALVEFDSVESAQLAMMGLNGQDIYAGCCTLKVDFSRTRRLNVHKNDDETCDFTAGIPNTSALSSLSGVQGNTSAAGGVYAGYSDAATSAYYQAAATNTGQSTQNWTNSALGWQNNNQSQTTSTQAQMYPQQDYSNASNNQQHIQATANMNQAALGGLNNDGKDLNQGDQGSTPDNSAVGFPTVQSILSKVGGFPAALQANPLMMQALIQQQQQKATMANHLPAGLMANHPLAKALQAAQAAQAAQLAHAAQFVQAQVAQARQVEAKKIGLLGNSPFGGNNAGTHSVNPKVSALSSMQMPGVMGLLRAPAGLTPVQQAMILNMANMGRSGMINPALLGKRPGIMGMLPGLFPNPGTYSNPGASAKMAAAAAVAAAAQKNLGNSGVPNCVVMVYGLNMKQVNCEKLFNMFCLFGNVMKVKFLLNKNGVAMVQMADKMAADMIMKNYGSQVAFENKLHLIYSKHPFIGDISTGAGCLPDGSPTAFNFTDSPKNRFKFAGDSGNLKNRFQPPCRMLHFFNAPPTCTIEDLQKLFGEAGAPVPSRGTFFAGRATGKSSSGLLEMNSISSAIEAVAICNHSALTTEGGTFTIKLAFSPSSSIPPTALTVAPTRSDIEKRTYRGRDSPEAGDSSSGLNTSLLGPPPNMGNTASILGDPPGSTSILGTPSSPSIAGSILGAPPIVIASGFHGDSSRGAGLLGEPPVKGDTAGLGIGDLGRKSLLGEPPAVANPLLGGMEPPSVGILGEAPTLPTPPDVGVPHSLAAQEAIGALVSMSSLPIPTQGVPTAAGLPVGLIQGGMAGFPHGAIHSQPLLPGMPQHAGGPTGGQ